MLKKDFRIGNLLPSSENRLGGGVTILLFILIVFPLIAVISQIALPGFFFGERNYTGFGLLLEVFQRPLWSRSLTNSLILATGTATFGTLLGVCLAMARTYWSFPTAKLMDITAWILLITPSFILAQGWVLFANPSGIASQVLGWEWISSFIFQPMGLIFVMSLCKFSLAYLAVAASLEWNVSHYGDAARLCGGHPFAVWRTIQFPLMLPAVVAGWALVFMDTIGDFGLPASLATVYRFPTLPYSIYTAVYTSPIRFDMAGVLALYLVLILVIAMGILYFAISRSRFDFLNSRAETTVAKPTKYAWLFTASNLLFIALVLGIPIGTSIMVSFMDSIGAGMTWSNLTLAHYIMVFDLGNSYLPSLINSLMIAGIAAVCSIIIGFFVSYVMCFTQFKYKQAINIFSVISLAVPGVVLGIGYIFVWNQRWLEMFHLHLYGTPAILILGAIAGAVPFAVRLQIGAFSKIPDSMMSAAAMQGASMWARMKDIVLPLVRSSLLVAGLAAFGTSVFDLALTSILNPPNYSILPVEINRHFERMQYGYSTAATMISGLAAITIILCIDTAVKWIFKGIEKKKRGEYHEKHIRSAQSA